MVFPAKIYLAKNHRKTCTSPALARPHSLPLRWECLASRVRSVILLVAVSLMFPVGAFCPRGCSCDDVGLRVQCSHADLDVIPILLHPATTELNLSHNKIKTILEGLIFYNELQYLDLSYNEIVSIGSQNFAFLKGLNTLVMSNNKLSRIQGRGFLGLSKLVSLDLSDNYIELIDEYALSSLTQLKSLDLSNNRIKNLALNTFQKLRGLKSLNLCKNEIRDIPTVVFRHLQALEHLDLCSNQITIVRNFAFQSMTSLEILMLNSNKVQNIERKGLIGLESLKVLSLKDNDITSIPSDGLSAIKSLEDLDIGINPLSSIPPGPFAELANLRTLHISRCENLSSLDPESFTRLNSLRSLTLSFNPQLSSLSRDLFLPLPNLQHLNLRGNGLKSFDRSLVGQNALQSLDLRDNRIECNCSLKWLQESASNKSRLLKVEEVFCSGPETLKGRRLSELSEYDLECFNNLIVIGSGAAASSVLFLLFLAFGFLYYKTCRKMKAVVHDHWPEKIATWRDPEYEKQIEEEEYTFHSLRGIQNIPVTVI